MLFTVNGQEKTRGGPQYVHFNNVCLTEYARLKHNNWRQWRRSGVFITNFEHISYLFLVFLLLTLSK